MWRSSPFGLWQSGNFWREFECIRIRNFKTHFNIFSLRGLYTTPTAFRETYALAPDGWRTVWYSEHTSRPMWQTVRLSWCWNCPSGFRGRRSGGVGSQGEAPVNRIKLTTVMRKHTMYGVGLLIKTHDISPCCPLQSYNSCMIFACKLSVDTTKTLCYRGYFCGPEKRRRPKLEAHFHIAV